MSVISDLPYQRSGMDGQRKDAQNHAGGGNQHKIFASFLVSFLLELTVSLILISYHWTKEIVMFFVPTKWIAKDIRGQTVLITGAGGSIGGMLAKRFADKGCHLVLWDVNEDMNRATAETVKDCGVKVSTYTVDVSNRESIYTMAQKVDTEVGRVDIVVNNAGIVTGKRALVANDDLMKKTMDVNALAHFWMAKAFVKQMVRRNSGHLVTVASAAGLYGIPGMSDYSASKFAAVGFEEVLRQELDRIEDNDIQTTVVCPFLIRTPMFHGCFAKYPFIMDALEPDYVADKIVDAVLRNQRILCLPKAMYVLAFTKALMPIRAQKALSDFAGASTLMDTFIGRQKSD